jgi:uncharacterized protein involved in response to NO
MTSYSGQRITAKIDIAECRTKRHHTTTPYEQGSIFKWRFKHFIKVTMNSLKKSWQTFTAAPHRMMFFGGVMQALLAVLWWVADLGGRFGSLYAAAGWSISPNDAHALLMIYGLFPFFIFGFLMTTYPRWMNGEEVERRHYVLAFLLLAAGSLLVYAGLLMGKSVLAAALLIYLGGWGISLYALTRVYFRAQHPDKRHAAISSITLLLGWLLLASFLAGMRTDTSFLIELAKTAGVWGLLLPVFFSVSHRMIPFFSTNAISGYTLVRPEWPLGVLPLLALAHAVLELSGLPGWTWLVDLPMAAIAFYLTWIWRLRASLPIPLLAMLHIGFAWLGIAMLLFAAQSLLLLDSGTLLLGRAPLHALVMGYFTALLFGMATRVTLGHSGRALVADRLTWWLFLLLQAATLLRVASDLPGIPFAARVTCLLITAAIWLGCFGIWAYHFAPIYWRPRLDGKPG